MAKLRKPRGISVVAMFISPGVKAGAGGFAIVNGKVIKVPPRGPAYRLISEAAQLLAQGARGGR